MNLVPSELFEVTNAVAFFLSVEMLIFFMVYVYTMDREMQRGRGELYQQYRFGVAFLITTLGIGSIVGARWVYRWSLAHHFDGEFLKAFLIAAVLGGTIIYTVGAACVMRVLTPLKLGWWFWWMLTGTASVAGVAITVLT